MMAMPLTPEQWRLLPAEDDWASWLPTPYDAGSDLLRRISEPRHQFVRYEAILDRVVYENPDVFYAIEDSPSSSRWMVPGTFSE